MHPAITAHRCHPHLIIGADYGCSLWPPQLRRGRANLLLKPMMRIRVVVEAGDLDVVCGPVQADGFDERLVRFESDSPGAPADSLFLELAQESAADAETACRLGDPHALDLRG